MKKKSSKHGSSISEEIEAALDAPRKAVKVRVTTMIDLSVKDELERRAEKLGVGYQTLINMILKAHINGESIEIVKYHSIDNGMDAVNEAIKKATDDVKKMMDEFKQKKMA
jgi:antitoxin component of RelBE/YafQ-DinJ toxin-antitoxin module